jgi:tetraacyldisaccharide-1-P 4'-kinase
MTEKDAVKCEDFAGKNFWSLRVELQLPDELVTAIVAKLPKFTPTKKKAKTVSDKSKK